MIFIGPFPPPVHGQAVATRHLARSLADHGVPLSYADTSPGRYKGALGLLVRVFRHWQAAVQIAVAKQPVYISANSNSGMWLTAFLVGVARIRRVPIFVHHHAFDHVRRRRANMVALAHLGGPGATHIVLGETMASQLRKHTPEVASTFVLNNAGLVEESLSTLPARSRGEALILGHLSNLSAEKGLAQTLDLACELKRRGWLGKMVVGGPANDDWTRAELANAKTLLGDMLDYRGPLHGDDKFQFFREIDVFVFPTNYRNEASPLVLLEAMSAGVPCLSIAIGCIADDLGGKGGFAFSPEVPFVQESLAVVDELGAHYASYSQSAREQFIYMLEQHRQQVELLSRRMTYV